MIQPRPQQEPQPPGQPAAVSGTLTCEVSAWTAAEASAVVGQTLVFTLEAGYSTPFRARVVAAEAEDDGRARVTLESIDPGHLPRARLIPGHLWPLRNRTGPGREEGPPEGGSNHDWALWLLGGNRELAAAVGRISGAITIRQDGSVVLELDLIGAAVNGTGSEDPAYAAAAAAVQRMTPDEAAPLLLLATLSNVPTPLTPEAMGRIDDHLVNDWQRIGRLARRREDDARTPDAHLGTSATDEA